LPKLTQHVIEFSKFFIGNLHWIVLTVVGVIFGYRQVNKTAYGKRKIDQIMLSLPIVGDLLRKIAVARFTRTMGTLLSSGVPIMDALEVVAKTAGNTIIEEAIMYVRAKIAEGKSMVEPLSERKIFPSMVVQMLGVGEQTGALDTMLSKIADFYEEEVDVAVAALTSLLEPILMVGIGGMVGTIMVAMYLPIFSIAGKIKSD
ncbi:MAG: type II secretion system F family protein, partial [Polyangiales bacterium]